MSAYYNEFDAYPAQWLRNLAGAGHIMPGTIDERSIADVQPEDLNEFTRAHFFAGIGGWDIALSLAGWPADAPVWTGSCPCQPFSIAGKHKGTSDERHLWPVWLPLIRERKPPIIFGEQVASPLGRAWLADVQTDLEALGYTFGAADLCAAGVGAAHIRQRLWFVAHTDAGVSKQYAWDRPRPGKAEVWGPLCRATGLRPAGSCAVSDSPDNRREGEGQRAEAGLPHGPDELRREPQAPDDLDFWGGAEWLACRDGKARPSEPGVSPLVDGVPGRLGRLRAYGNAIVPQVAAVFIRAFMESR